MTFSSRLLYFKCIRSVNGNGSLIVSVTMVNILQGRVEIILIYGLKTKIMRAAVAFNATQRKTS